MALREAGGDIGGRKLVQVRYNGWRRRKPMKSLPVKAGEETNSNG